MEVDFDKLLETYSLEDILYESDLTETQVLEILYDQGVLKLPKVLPVG